MTRNADDEGLVGRLANEIVGEVSDKIPVRPLMSVAVENYLKCLVEASIRVTMKHEKAAAESKLASMEAELAIATEALRKNQETADRAAAAIRNQDATS